MPLTPEDVRNKQFTTVRLREGYDEDEVDAFLDEVEAELTRLLRENEDLRAKLAAATRAAAQNQQQQGMRKPEPQDQQARRPGCPRARRHIRPAGAAAARRRWARPSCPAARRSCRRARVRTAAAGPQGRPGPDGPAAPWVSSPMATGRASADGPGLAPWVSGPDAAMGGQMQQPGQQMQGPMGGQMQPMGGPMGSSGRRCSPGRAPVATAPPVCSRSRSRPPTRRSRRPVPRPTRSSARPAAAPRAWSGTPVPRPTRWSGTRRRSTASRWAPWSPPAPRWSARSRTCVASSASTARV